MGREPTNQDASNQEANTIAKIANDQRLTSTKLVNKGNTASLGNKRNDVVDSLIFESVGAADSDLAVNPNTVVLNSRYTGHLDGCLNGTSQK